VAVVAEGSEAGRWIRGRPRLRGAGGLRELSSGDGCAAMGDWEIGLPWPVGGVGRGEGLEG
jgi:hypothetical protein